MGSTGAVAGFIWSTAAGATGGVTAGGGWAKAKPALREAAKRMAWAKNPGLKPHEIRGLFAGLKPCANPKDNGLFEWLKRCANPEDNVAGLVMRWRLPFRGRGVRGRL